LGKIKKIFSTHAIAVDFAINDRNLFEMKIFLTTLLSKLKKSSTHFHGGNSLLVAFSVIRDVLKDAIPSGISVPFSETLSGDQILRAVSNIPKSAGPTDLIGKMFGPGKNSVRAGPIVR
jgi:hypothetical protein